MNIRVLILLLICAITFSCGGGEDSSTTSNVLPPADDNSGDSSGGGTNGGSGEGTSGGSGTSSEYVPSVVDEYEPAKLFIEYEFDYTSSPGFKIFTAYYTDGSEHIKLCDSTYGMIPNPDGTSFLMECDASSFFKTLDTLPDTIDITMTAKDSNNNESAHSAPYTLTLQ